MNQKETCSCGQEIVIGYKAIIRHLKSYHHFQLMHLRQWMYNYDDSPDRFKAKYSRPFECQRCHDKIFPVPGFSDLCPCYLDDDELITW